MTSVSVAQAAERLGVSDLAVSLRSVFRNRARRRLFRAAPADLDDLRADERWQMIVDLGASGNALADVEGCLGESDVDAGSRLRLAADLAESSLDRLVTAGEL